MRKVVILFFLLCTGYLLSGAQLPVVNLTADSLSPVFSAGLFRLDNGEEIAIQIRYRGSTSLAYTKKSFAIKLLDETGKKLNKSLLGMRSDNSWILDAMTIDKARMRNRVSTDLWNDFSSKSYISYLDPEAYNGTHGKFVEVYLNNEYWGLYCLTEKIDRKQLKLKKFKGGDVKGVLYKSNGWSTLHSVDDAFYKYDNSSAVWHALEMSYPDVEEGEPIDWKPLADDIYWMSYSDSNEVNQHFREKFDLPVWEDYFLFVEFLMADDNICKNLYLYYYDVTDDKKKLGVAPWDLDHSWGRSWSSDTLSAEVETETWFNRVSYLMQYVCTNLDKTYQERYKELRQTFFTPEKLKQRFAAYFDLFRQTGAAERERKRWSGVNGIALDFDSEEQYIYNWIDRRFAFMDKKYSDVPEGIKPAVLDDAKRQNCYKCIIDNKIVIVKNGKKYNILGQEIK